MGNIDGQRLAIQVLGGFRVTVDSVEVPAEAWSRRNAAAIVKILALAPGHRVHREHVMDLLWPDSDPKQAANNLYQTLHVARRALEQAHPQAGDVLRLHDQIVHFRSDTRILVDAVEFEQAALEAAAQRDVRRYRIAAGLYHGDLLPDDPYESWTGERRESLRRERLALLQEMALLQDEAGDAVGALSTWRRVVAADPLNEPAHRALMRLYVFAGQRQQAIRQFEELRETLARELEVEPEPESAQLHAQVLSGDAAAPVVEKAGEVHSWARHNLPAPANQFIGRERQKVEVGRLLRSTRLLTLVGPGGCGKSRLSLEVATQVVDGYRDGVWLVELASLSDPDLVPQAVAGALGIREMPGALLVDTLNNWLRTREVLLLLDNCEHLIDACAGLAESLLQTSPELDILATSREPLRISGETTWQVPSLTLPDPNLEHDVTYLRRYEAVQLFVDRACRAWPDFELTAENAAAVAMLCYRLDGIPLAIELAAARVRALSVAQIVDRLSDRFRLLKGGSRAAMSRQQTLRAALDWSYNLLSEQERILFARLSVFPGGFDLEAAEEICAIPPLERSEILDLLLLLVDRSLVAVGGSAGAARYTLLETMREYASERLVDRGEADIVREAHARYYTTFALNAAGQIRIAHQKMWLARLEREHDNIRASLEWHPTGANQDHAEHVLFLAGSLYWFWHLQGHFSEGNRRLRRLLRSAPDQPSKGLGMALTGAGALTLAVGDYSRSRDILDRAIAVWRELDDPVGLWEAITWSGWIELFHGHIPEARARHEEGLALATRIGNRWGVAMATLGLGFDAAQAGEHEQARTVFLRTLEMYQDIGDYWGTTMTLEQLANLTYRMGDFAEARKRAEDVLALEQASGDKWLELQGQGLLGEIARAEGDLDRAAASVEISLALAGEIGHVTARAWSLRDAGFIALATADLGKARRCFEESMSLFHERGYQLGIACCITGMGGLAIAEGQFTEGVRFLSCAQTGLAAIQIALAPADRLAAESFVSTARRSLDPVAFDAAWSAGAAMTFDDAMRDLVAGAS